MPRAGRRIAAVLIALFAVALLVTAPSGQPRGGGTLAWATHQDVDQTDVHKSFALLTGMVLGRNVFDRLDEHNLTRGAATIGFERRAPLYREAQPVVWWDAPWIFLAERREAAGRRATLQGVTAIPSSAGLVDVRRASIR